MNDPAPESPLPPDPAPTPAAAEPAPAPQAARPARDRRDRGPRSKPQVMEGLAAHVGSLRGRTTGEDAAPAPVKEKPSRSNYPAPRPGRTTPELEQEIEAALGGMSLEDVLAEKSPRADVGDLPADTRLKGRVVAVHREDVFFDVGGSVQGFAPLLQFSENPEVGQEVDLIVVRFNANEGLYEVTRPGQTIAIADWGDIDEGTVVDATVTGHNKGGLECKVGGTRAFMPVSQVALYLVENLEEFVGQSFPCVVTEANRERGNLVLSRRAVLEREQAEAKEKLLAELAPGQTREGVVRSLQDFGAFVDLGGVDGLIHISQLAWERVKHPSEVLKLGQKVKVVVEKIDPKTGKIGLSYRETFDNPWNQAEAKYTPHSTHTGTVSKIMDFGAFVRLEPGVEGLIHVSELAHQRVRRVSDVVSEGQEVQVKIISLDKQAQRISLSLKALAPEPIDPKVLAEEKAMDALEASNKPVKLSGPLKGGLGRPSGGEQFGLKW